MSRCGKYWRVFVPPSENGGVRTQRFFKVKADALDFVDKRKTELLTFA